MMQINSTQVTDLASHFVNMRGQLESFFNDPDNQKAYREWHLKKYGCEPDKEVTV